MSSPKRLALLAALTLVYVAAGRFGLSLAFVNESATAVWPPTGIAIAACLLGGVAIWPAIFAGALVVNLTTSGLVLPSLLIACGNTAEAVLACWVLQRTSGGVSSFDKTTGILAYVGIAAAATALAATVGVSALIAANLALPDSISGIWLTWWTGDLASAVLLTPAILAWARRLKEPWPSPKVVEAILLALTGALLAYWVFGPSASGTRRYPLMFVMLPALLWAAQRFGLHGAAAAVLGIAGVATWGTLNGFGPFARWSTNESLLLLQAYLGVKMIAMMTLAAEVTARRRAERDLRQLNIDLERRIRERSEELQRLHGRLAEAQQVAHIGSWEWDVAADSVWWSDEMYRVYGLEIGSPITYERYLGLVHPEDRDRVNEIVGASARSGESFTFEHRAIKPDGTCIMIHSRGRVVTDADGRVVRMLGIGHDITERKRAEEERLELVRAQAARLEAEEANRMKDHFLATLSHELRTPLNAVVGWAEVLKRLGADERLRAKAIDAIHRNVGIQAQLVSDILDVTRIRSGATIVDGALDVLEPVIAAKQIHVGRDIGDDLVVMGDARRLQQVCWNILTNASKFVEPGGSIAIVARRENESIMLRIDDDGPGIPEDFLPYVFDQFRQADPSITRLHGGLGLGLAISHDLVRLHGGSITVANRPNGGASFTVRLPAAPGDRVDPPEAGTAAMAEQT